MEIKSCGNLPTKRAPTDYFTGTVWQDRIVEPAPPARLAAVLVRFEPGARTAWHTHPLGQTLYVVAGSGLAQSAGGPVQKIRAGDVVSFPPGEKHWHGAGPSNFMEHLAMQEALDGSAVEWLEYVTDQEYSAGGS